MTYWKVDPAAVGQVLARAEQERSGYEDATRAVEEATGAGIAAAVGPRTAAALRALASDPFGLDIEAASRQVETAIGAVRSALATYEQGDDTMARDIAGAAQVVPR